MPEHVHLLVFPTVAKPAIDDFLSATKRPTSVRIKKWIETSDPKLLRELTIQERPGKKAFRFWQEGPG